MDRQGRRKRRGKPKPNKAPTRPLTEATIPPQVREDTFIIRHFNIHTVNEGEDFYSRSSAAVASRRRSADRDGGYDYEFVSNPPDELNCSICLSVLRDPNLTSCCGNHFCQSCISRIKNKRNPCPLCQEQDFTVMLDKFFARRVNELKIKCPNSSHGCEWMGELGSIGKHLDVSCGFVEVTCDYCQSEDILRQNLAVHKKVCPSRPYSCEYCGHRDKWEVITMVHHVRCEKYPVECPNKCGVEKVQRRKLDKHVREECPLEEIGCEFEYAGCQVRQPRKNMTLHLSENVSSHLGMVASHFQKKLVEKDEMVDELRVSQKKLAEKDEMIDELRVCNNTQSRQLSALKSSVQSQEREISSLRAYVHSQRKQMEELETNAESQSRALEKVEVEVDGIKSLLYVQIFRLLKDIALRNRDLQMSKKNEASVFGAAIGGAAIGGAAGRAMGPAGAIVGAVLGGSVGAIAAFASGKPEAVVSVLSNMGEKEKEHVASTAVKVAQECNLMEPLVTKSILDSPAGARSFLMTVLKRMNFEVHVNKYRRR